MPNFGLLLPAASVATLVRLRAVCEWHDLSTCHAFLTAVGHNRRDVVQRLCTPRTSGGCGLSLAANAAPQGNPAAKPSTGGLPLRSPLACIDARRPKPAVPGDVAWSRL